MPVYSPIPNRLTKVISASNKQFLAPGPHSVHILIMDNLAIFVNIFKKICKKFANIFYLMM